MGYHRAGFQHGLNQAIPPAYTEHLGQILLEVLS